MRNTKLCGVAKNPEYWVWMQMRRRCNKPKCSAYHKYGAKGIKVCERWDNSFKDFFSDMGPRPSDQHSLDRYPNKEGNYEPGNVRWATPTEQALNTKRNIMLTLNGETMCVTYWGEKLGIPFTTITARLKRGMPVEQALTSKRDYSTRFKKGQNKQ